MKLLVRWFLSAVALIVIARFLPGFHVSGFGAALLAAAVIGLVNATLGAVVKFVTFPLTIITLGLFLLLINAVMLKIAAAFVPGFRVDSWFSAIVVGVLLSVVSSFLHWLVGNGRHRERE